MEDNLVLKVYRNKKDSNQLNLGIEKGVNGLELYRIALTLLNKVIELSKSQNDNISIDLFLDDFVKDFKKIIKKDE